MACLIHVHNAALVATGRTLLQRLDPVTRARVLMALLGLVILGLGMVVLVWLAGRAARRYRQRSFAPPREDESIRPSERMLSGRQPASQRNPPEDGGERS